MHDCPTCGAAQPDPLCAACRPTPRYTVSHINPCRSNESQFTDIGTYPDKTRAIQAVQRHMTEQRVEHGEIVIITTNPGYYVIQPEVAE